MSDWATGDTVRGEWTVIEVNTPEYAAELAAARSAGFDLAVAALRDEAAWALWRASEPTRGILDPMPQHTYAAFLAAVKADVLGTEDATTKETDR